MKPSSILPLLVSALVLLALGPCSRVPGGRLNGEVAEAPDDWSFVDDLGTCALETRPSAPHSVTVTCYSHEGELYVGSKGAPDKSWPRYVLEDTRVRYRAGDRVYELIATRIEEPERRDAVYAARRALGGAELEPDLQAPEDYWIFQLQPRTVAASPSGAGGLRAFLEGIVAASDRSAEDREKDARRRPVELLLFAGVEPGMQVGDLAAGSGYTTELLARAVGPEGLVHGHNTPATIKRYVSDTWPARLEKDVMENVVRTDSELEEPLPGVRDLDLITMVFYYHDTLYMDVDRARVNAAVFEALRPGGSFVVVDHHAVPGSGEEVAKTLHRVDEQLVRSEIEAAGFRLVDEGDFLRNPDDPREEPFFELDMPTDAFVHRYVKPQ